MVAKDVNSRSGDQCWKRWNDSLDPHLNHSPWTPAEDQILEEAVLHAGRLWSKIASESLPGRSGLGCKNRWDHIQRKQRRIHQSQRDIFQAHDGANSSSRSLIDTAYLNFKSGKASAANNTFAAAGALGVSANNIEPENYICYAKLKDRSQRHTTGISREPTQPKYEYDEESRPLFSSSSLHKTNFTPLIKNREHFPSTMAYWGGIDSHTVHHSSSSSTSGNTTLSSYAGYQTSFSSPMTDSRTLPTAFNYGLSSAYPFVGASSYPPIQEAGSMGGNSGATHQQRVGGFSTFSPYPPQYARRGPAQTTQLLATLDPGSCTGGMLTYAEGEVKNSETMSLGDNIIRDSTTEASNGSLFPSSGSLQSPSSFAASWQPRAVQSMNAPRGFASLSGHSAASRANAEHLTYQTKSTAGQPTTDRLGMQLDGHNEQSSASALYVPKSTSLSGLSWSSSTLPRDDTYTPRPSLSQPFTFSTSPAKGLLKSLEEVKSERKHEGWRMGSNSDGKPGASPAHSRDELASSARGSEPLASPCPGPRVPKVEHMPSSVLCNEFECYRKQGRDHSDFQDDDFTSEEEDQLSIAPKHHLTSLVQTTTPGMLDARHSNARIQYP